MKKSLVLAMGLLATATTMAAEKTETAQPAPQKETRPVIGLVIYNTSGKVATPIKGLQYSLKKAKNLQLCWEVINTPLTANNLVIEEITAPAKSKFVSKDSNVVTSEDGKAHTVSTQIPSTTSEFLRRCWNFDKTDPKGTYSIKVRVNNIQFNNLNFEIVK